MSSPKIALIYDKVNTPYGGAENVLAALHEVFPDAPLFTTVYGRKAARWAHVFDVRPSWLQHIPFLQHMHLWLTPLFPIAIESLDVSEYDIVISITSSQAKGVLTTPHQLHICYLLTPTRYLFSHKSEYLQAVWWLRLPLIKQVVAAVADYLAWWDKASAARPDVIIPISKLVQQRTQQYYNRTTVEPLYPTIAELPNSTEKDTQQKKFLLVSSRLVPYKRVDLAIQAALNTNKTLVIIGTGTDQQRLQKLAGSSAYIRSSSESVDQTLTTAATQHKTIIFMGTCSDQERSQLYNQASAFLMLGLEDFGITALEAALQDIPTIIHQDSGVAEVLGKHAITIAEESVTAVEQALTTLEKQPPPTLSLTSKQKMITKQFASNFSKLVYDLWHHHQAV